MLFCLGLKRYKVCLPFGVKIRRVDRLIFLGGGVVFKIWMQKCNIIHVCAFLGMQSIRINLILVLEGGCIPLYLFKGPYWDSYKKILMFYLDICDVIKQYELALVNTVFKIQPDKTDRFFCFLLFVQSFSCLYLWNQLPNLCGFSPSRKCQKNKTKQNKNHIFWLQTHFAWSHHILLQTQNRVSEKTNKSKPTLVLWSFGSVRKGQTNIFFFFFFFFCLIFIIHF